MPRRSLSNPFATLRRAVTRFLPPACAGCDGHAAPDQAFCPVCAPVVHRLSPPRCAVCAVPMQQFPPADGADSECSRCRRRPPNFAQIRACWVYDGAVADAVRRLKYGDDFAALRALCRGARSWFRTRLAGLPPKAPIVPVPSHSESLCRRGFHVPTMALHLLLPRTERRRIEHRLQKTRLTPRQASLPLVARRDNVRGVFADRSSAPAEGPALLFDDVVTTGATADAAADALRVAGFGEVHVITLARAPHPSPSP